VLNKNAYPYRNANEECTCVFIENKRRRGEKREETRKERETEPSIANFA